jgi:hypothetical protein
LGVSFIKIKIIVIKKEMHKQFIYIFLLLFYLSACNPDLDYKFSGYTQKIIVEGSIASGEYPVVYLSLNVPLSEQVDSATILKNIIARAKVTVSTGDSSEVLTAGYFDKSRYPFHVYKGTELKGVVGKTYTLLVEYGGYSFTSQTTVPSPATNITFNSLATKDNDTLRILSISFDINPTKATAYRVFTKKRRDTYYVETPEVFNASLSLSGTRSFTISPSPSPNDSSYNEGNYFVKGDSVLVRVCAIDSTSTQFFKAMTRFSTNTGIANTYFVGEKDALQSNVSEPGFGIWWGTGITKTSIKIQ